MTCLKLMPSLRDIYKKPDTISDIITTKGDLISRNDNTPVRLGVGVDNQVLVSDSTTEQGIRWAFVDIGFATVNSSFTTPNYGSNVTINISTNRWIYAGMYVYIQDAGLYYVISKSGSNSITVRNEYTDNTIPGTNIGIARGVVPAGRRGSDGNNSYTITTANFVIPTPQNTVSINVEYTAWVSINQLIYITGAGYYQIINKTSNTLVIKNLGYDGNTSSGTVNSGAVITTSGIKGLDGINASSYTSTNYTQPAINNNVIVALEDTRWLNVGQSIYIEDAGNYVVIDIISLISVEIQNTGSVGNAQQGTVFVSGKKVSASGKTGLPGTNAVVTTLANSFVQPAENDTVIINVVTTEFLSVGSYIYIPTGGFYKVTNIDSNVQLTIQNLSNLADNANPGITINSGLLITPSGIPGRDGMDGTDGQNGQGIDHIELTSSLSNIDTYTIWGDAGETINLGTFDVIKGQDGVDGATGSVNAATNLSLEHQIIDPSAVVDKLILYSMLDGLYYRQPDGNISQVLIDTDIGTDIGNIVELVDVNGSAGLPAVDGSQLTNLPQGGHTIQNEGNSLNKRENLNFKGDLVNATDNVDTTDITVNSGLTNLGDILYHDGTTIAPLAKGTNGQILASDDVNGLTWIDAPTGGGTGTFDSPTTTKGDLIVRGETEDTRLPVGLEDTFLSPDPTSPTGLTWKSPIVTGSGLTIKDEGIDLVARPNINFTGDLVTAEDNSATNSTDVIINLPNTIDLGLWTP